MKQCYKILLLIVVITACGGPNGRLYQVGNLEIFYIEKKVDFKYVQALGDFFKTHDLIHPSAKHSIKLTSNSDEFVLKMILNDSLEQVPLDMLKEIELLEAAIASNVFKNLNFVIQITDSYFNPLIKIKD